jgi:iron complex outermembrane receptor protein
MKLKRTPLGTAIAGLCLVPAAATLAQDNANVSLDGNIAEIVVTSTRRAATVQDVPINITAVGGDAIETLGIEDVDDAAKLVPGLTLVDQGPRGNNRIIVRGLNASNINTAGADQDGGGTVATYLGETPLYVDFKLLDIQRVEAMLGPQGTLYGAGTLAGAVRYIPNKPDLDESTVDFHGRSYMLKEGDGTGYNLDSVVNLPIIPGKFAIRSVFGFYDDPGFIDYTRIVREPGTSNPDPDPNDPDEMAANLITRKDLNFEDTFATRISALFTPTDWMEALLTYAHQDTKTGGRQIQHVDATGTGRYEAGARWEEPSHRTVELTSLELNFDFGFADLVSSSSYADQHNRSTGDQTDLLLDLSDSGGYGYEDFPQFIAFTTGYSKKEQYTQELRLVSKGDSRLSWIGGVFYNKVENDSLSIEYTPGLADFLGAARADDMEYYSKTDEEIEEQAAFGEIGFRLTDKWQMTAGARYYDYTVYAINGTDLPLLNSGPTAAYELSPRIRSADGADDGALFKFNTSYDFTDDFLMYATVSEGYRLGGINTVAPCPELLEEDEQYVCALPDEISFEPDKTLNYELGLHTQWFGSALTLNAAVYFIEWEDVQLGTVTKNGAVGITGNGGKAESKGVELAMHAALPMDFSISANYAYNKAELTEDVPGLLVMHVADTDPTEPGAQPGNIDVDALAGDRLPGSPEHKGAVFLGYARQIASDYVFKANYGVSFQSSVVTKPGAQAAGEELGGYATHDASFGIEKDTWQVMLYGENIFNKYAYTAVGQDRSFLYNAVASDGREFDVRRYGRYVLRPASFGVDFRM